MESIDALFVPFFSNIDRWHNDDGGDWLSPSLAKSRGLLDALRDDIWMKDEVDLVIDGRLYDFSRFLSWVQSGHTGESERFDPFNITLLSGSHYLSFLHREGFNVRVANALDRKRAERLASRYTPRFVMLSTTLLFDAAELDLIPIAVKTLRQCWPDAIIVLGGLLLVSNERIMSPDLFDHMLLRYGADCYVVTPQGERVAVELLRHDSMATLLEGPLPPRTYVVNRGHVRRPKSTAAESPVSLDDSAVRWNQLPQTDHLYHMVHTRTARSCAFKCAFCEYPVNQGPLELMSTDAFERQLQELAALGTVRSLVFTDDTFNVPLRRFKEMMRVLARYDFEWYSFFRPQYADVETARLMANANCKAVFAGLESVDAGILKNMSKVAKPEQYRQGLSNLRHYGIAVHCNFFVGFPGETEATARKIVPFLDDLEIEFITVCTWIYMPSTPIGRRSAEFGIQGMGVDWKHNTMTSSEAQVIARAIVDEQKYAVHNAVRGEAWSEFLLYGNGFSVDEARLAIGTYNRYVGRDVSAEEIRTSPAFTQLGDVLREHPMPWPAGY